MSTSPTISSVTLNAADADITVQWNAIDPSLNGGSAILGYYLQINSGYGTDFIEPGQQIVLPATLSYTFTGLIQGATYKFRVAAYNEIYTTNALGEELNFSPELNAIAAIPPAKVASLIQDMTKLKSGTINIEWTEPADNGSPILYYNLYKDNGLGVFYRIYRGIELKYNDTQLIEGGSYTYKVVAVNSAGVGTESDTLVGVAGELPSVPQNLRIVTQSKTSLVIAWDVPADIGGLTILNYIVNEDEADLVYGPDISTTMLTHTKNIAVADEGKTFSFKVAAQNSLGVGEYAADIQLIAADEPDPPSMSLESRGTNWLYLRFAPGVNDGGSAITGYVLYRDEGVTGSPISERASVSSSQILYNTTNLLPGRTYTFELIETNAAHSSTAYSASYTVGSAPGRAPEPTFVSSSRGTIGGNDGTITIKWEEVEAQPDLPITKYLLYIDNEGDGVFGTAIEHTDLSNLQYEFTGLADGAEYGIKIQAQNIIGKGEESNVVYLAAVGIPDAPAAPVYETSTKTSISIAWSPPTNTGGRPLTGYKVYMNDFKSASYTLIYDGSSAPSVLSLTQGNLTTGNEYRFKVRAIGYNEEGPDSNAASFYVCTSPSGFESPTAVQVTRTSIQIQWKAPNDNGGCPLTGYAVYRIDRISNIATEANTANDPAVRGNPSLDEMTITNFPASSEGDTFGIKVVAISRGGQTDSGVIWVVLASVPDAPSTGPVEVPSETTISKISVTYGTTPPDNGGSPILSYSLEIDDGKRGSFTKLVGFTSNSLFTAYTVDTGIVKGREYRLRYRAKNIIGWSEYSDISYVTASQEPAQANIPEVTSFSDTSITLSFDQNVDNMGSEITSYELYWDTGSTPTTYTEVTSYDGISTTFTLPSGTDTITPGEFYNFKYAARNARGLGEDSYSVQIAASNLLSAPTGLAKDNTQSTANRIVLTWDASTPVNLPSDEIKGYRLYVFNKNTLQYERIFDGVANFSPTQTTYSYTDVIPGEEYKFKVSVVTFRESSLSTALNIYACTAPSGMAAPTIDEVTLSSITISWTPPVNSGGCPIDGYVVYLDDGTGFFEVNSVNDPAVRNNPGLHELTITNFGTATLGSIVRVKVQVDNGDTAFSPSKDVLIATKPNKPSTLVNRVDDESDENKLTVEFTTLSSADANGSPIISYSLEVREGTGDFKVYSGANDIKTMKTKHTLTSPWVSKGNTYGFRFRAKNAYGWSPYSDIAYLTVAGIPEKPSRLIASAYSSTEITVDIPTITDNGGSTIIAVGLEYADGLTSTSFSAFPNCDGLVDTSCTIGVADGLTAGHIYKFRHKVSNAYYDSEYSDEISVGLVDSPSPVLGLSKVASKSNTTAITLTWNFLADRSSPAGVIRVYKLYMVDPSISNEQFLVYNGYGLPHTNTYTVTGLHKQQEYRFAVTAIDFNGEGTQSSELIVYACSPPSGVPKPQLVSSTTTSITIEWGSVADYGGCPLTGFAVYRNEGDNSDPTTEVNSVNDAAVRNNPSLHELTVTYFPASSIGKSFKFKLEAYNREGSGYSETVAFTLASLPSAPTVGPQEDTDRTSDKQIAVTLNALLTTSETGGSIVQNYELAMKTDGTFESILNTTTLNILITENIVGGKTYGFKYRARNRLGYGPYSTTTYIIAAKAPSSPEKPQLVSVDATEISLSFTPSADNGGIPIDSYELQMEVESTSTVTDVNTYVKTSLAMTHQLLVGPDSITAGEIYTFTFRAHNSEGYSDWSEGLSVALVDPPAQVTGLDVDRDLVRYLEDFQYTILFLES